MAEISDLVLGLEDPELVAILEDLVNLVKGQVSIPVRFSGLDDDGEFALTVQNHGTGGALDVFDSANAELFRINDSGATFWQPVLFNGEIQGGDGLVVSGGVHILDTGLQIDGGGGSITGKLTTEDGIDSNDKISISAGGLEVNGGVVVQDTGLTVDAGGILVTLGGLTVSAGGGSITGKLTTEDGIDSNDKISITSGGLEVNGGVTVQDTGITVDAGGIVITLGGLDVHEGITVPDGGIAVSDGITVNTGGLDVTGFSLFNDHVQIDNKLEHSGSTLGFYGATPVAQDTVSSSRSDPNGALKDLLEILDTLGLVVDSSTA